MMKKARHRIKERRNWDQKSQKNKERNIVFHVILECINNKCREKF